MHRTTNGVSRVGALLCLLLGCPAQAQAPSDAKPTPAQSVAANAVAAAKTPVSGDQVTVTTRVTPDEPRVGDLITYQINVAYPQGFAVNLPRLLDLKPLSVVETQEGKESSSGQGLVRQFTLVLQAFSLGKAKIPSFELTYVDAQAQVHTKRVPAQKIEMRVITANEAEPERLGEDPMVSPEYPNRRAELVIFAILAGVLLAGIGYALWRWMAAKHQAPTLVPVVPPHEVATQRLDRLEAGLEQRFKDGAGVLFYLELTEVAKTYLGDRHQVDCLDRTTDELEQELVRNPELFGALSPKEIGAFLRNCDLIKFARVATDVDRAKEELALVRGWIETSEESRVPKEESAQPLEQGAPIS